MKIKEFFKRNKFVIAFVFLLISVCLVMMLRFVRESDYFWHIKAGEYMLSNSTILKKDIFSWFMSGKYWMSHEWLFEIIIYGLSLVFTKFHGLIYSFCSLLILLLILFFTNKKNYLKNIPFSLIWITFILIFMGFIQARPHMFSFSFIALTIYFLYDLWNNQDSKKIYLLPIIAIFWSNFHGGSSNLSYLFCLIFILAGLFKFKFSKIEAKRISKKQLKKYLIVMIFCMIGVCINPHGIKMFIYPYVNILDNLMVSSISEWRPTVLSEPTHYLYFILLVVIIFVLLFSKKKIQLIDFLLIGVVVFLGLKSIRFWPYTYIVLTYVIFNYINERKYDKGTLSIIYLLGCLLCGITFINSNIILKSVDKTYIDEKMISMVKSVNPKRLYNMYDNGGELIYNDISVFVDGRADLYSGYNYEDYLNISKLQGNYVKLINKYDFDYFLVDKSWPIYVYLKYDDSYEKVYSSKNLVLYKKVF